MTKRPSIVLASGSPRRRELLTALGFEFTVQVPDVDERAITAPSPRTLAIKTAMTKALALDELMPRGTLLVAADTVVALGNEVFGKPENEDDAKRMLRRLSGHTHQVVSGVCLREAGVATLLDAAVTEVTLRNLTDPEIDQYIATGEPADKAGAYGIQGRAAAFVDSIRGDYYNVVGLPLQLTVSMLADYLDPAPHLARLNELSTPSFPLFTDRSEHGT